MKKQLLLIILFFLSLNASAQVKFEKGYFIDEYNNMIECYIKNYDWLFPPTEIEYQLSDKHQVETMSFDRMNAFQIVNTPHYYVKSIVEVDKNFTTKGFDPKTQMIILKVVLEGKASLYFYSNMFFYNINGGKIKQLVYKNYEDNNSRIKEDSSFRRELYDNLKCENKILDTRKLGYSKDELVAFFKEYNSCSFSNAKTFDNNKVKLNLKISAGLAMTKMNFPIANLYNTVPSFGKASLPTMSGTNIIYGLEVEAVLPFNKKKWSVFFAPNYQQLEYETEKENIISEYGSGKFIFKSNYSYIDYIVGARHYFYLSQKSNLFVEGAYSYIVLNEVNESKIYEPNEGATIVKSNNKTSSISSARVGLGYSYNNRYYFSLNYHPKKYFANSEISGFSFIASYKLF
jgi:hypothetical protein